MTTSDNLLLHLHKLASGQDENFTTEAFAHLLRHLLSQEPGVGVTILRKLSGGAVDLNIKDADLVRVATQVVVEEGRPDIAIRTPNHLVYVEVKVQSGLGFRQLERYRAALDRSGVGKTTLVFLTHFPEMSEASALPDVAVRWYQVADWLNDILVGDEAVQQSTVYLIMQFLGFVGARGMLLEHVNGDLIHGVHSLRSLLKMMGEAVAAEKVPHRPAVHWHWIGYNIEGQKYNVNVHFDNPTVLRCNTRRCQIDESKARALGFGHVFEDKGIGWRWENRLDIASEEVGFFLLAKSDQLRFVENYVRDSLRTAREITIDASVEIPLLAADDNTYDEET